MAAPRVRIIHDILNTLQTLRPLAPVLVFLIGLSTAMVVLSFHLDSADTFTLRIRSIALLLAILIGFITVLFIFPFVRVKARKPRRTKK